MKQLAFSIKTSEDADDCLQEFSRKCPEQHSAILISIFSSWHDESSVMPIADKLREALPDAIIVCSSTAGEILGGRVSVGTTILHFMVFSSTRLQVRAIDLAAASAEKGISSLLAACKGKEIPAGVELLIANNDVRLYQFLRRLQELPRNIPIFGGVAGNIDKASPYVIADGKVLRGGIVALLFIGQDLNIQVNTCRGWRSLGPWFQITSMKAENVIAELDNRPALLVYEKYLAISREDFEQDNLLFPLLLQRNGHRLLRLPATATPEGALIISADCRPGERVRLAYGDPSELIDASQDMQGDIAAFEPQAIMLFNCVTRRFFLRNAANNELQPFQDIATCVGFYTGGEVARQDDGDTSLLNMTLVAVSLREGARTAQTARAPSSVPSVKSLSGTMKLVRHLTHFITMTSQELELANQQLAELATMDRLTGLYNRGEIESILQNELSDRRRNKKHISGIMVDLDDFKRINDTHGHDVGDQVLKWTGRVLRNNIRRGDAAGRWGGEEFFIVLTEAPLATAINVAERIREKLIEGFTLPDGNRVTASFGVAEFSEHSSHMDFYRLLDANLYRAKREGKNRVCADR